MGVTNFAFWLKISNAKMKGVFTGSIIAMVAYETGESLNRKAPKLFD